MHYARQDLLWLKYHLNVEPKNTLYKSCFKISCTASSFHGYKDLVKELCSKDISKRTAKWLSNPNLTSKKISYAAQDTEYLFEIKKLTDMLIEKIELIFLINVWKLYPH